MISEATSYMAAGGITGMAQEVLAVAIAVGVTIAIVLGIAIGLWKAGKIGIGAGIAAVLLGIVFSVVIGSAVGIRELVSDEVENRGIVPRSTYGQ